MRGLSMSDTFRFATSQTRRPAPEATLSAALYFRPGGGFEQTRHLLLAQHDRRSARLVHGRQRKNEVGPFERHGEKKAQRGAGGVDRPCAHLLLRHMQLKAAKVLLRRRIWRPAEEGRKHSHIPNVVPLGVLIETARRHVVDHALAQRADGLVEHRESSCLTWGSNPMILRQSDASRCPGLQPLTPTLAAHRESGLVRRREADIEVRSALVIVRPTEIRMTVVVGVATEPPTDAEPTG